MHGLWPQMNDCTPRVDWGAAASHLISSNPNQSHASRSDLIQFHAISCNLMQSHAISSNLIQSHPSPSNLIQSHPISPNPIQSHPISSNLISCVQDCAACTPEAEGPFVTLDPFVTKAFFFCRKAIFPFDTKACYSSRNHCIFCELLIQCELGCLRSSRLKFMASPL